MDIFATLQEERGRLSQSENRIADILLNDFEFAVNASIIELAGKADVSPPTVTRFCRRLGCEAFPISRCSWHAHPMSACAT